MERPVEEWERGKFLLVEGVVSKPELNGQIVELFDNKGREDPAGVLRFKCGLWDSTDKKKFMLLKADNLKPVLLPTDKKLFNELATIAYNVDNISKTLRGGNQCDRQSFISDAKQQLARALEIWPPSGCCWMFRENFAYFEKAAPTTGWVRPPTPVAPASTLSYEAQALPMLWRALGNCVPNDVTMNLSIRSSLGQELGRTTVAIGSEAWRENYRVRCDIYRSIVQRFNPKDVDTWPIELAAVLIEWCKDKSGLSDAEREASIEESLEILVRLKAKARVSRLTSATGRDELKQVNYNHAAACQRLWWLAVEQENKGRKVIEDGGERHGDEAYAHFVEAERLLARGVDKWGDDDPATNVQLQYVRFRMNPDLEVKEFSSEPVNIKGNPPRVGVSPITQAGVEFLTAELKKRK